MYQWEAAMVVLFETSEGTSQTAKYVAGGIRRRKLCHGGPFGLTPDKTIRTIMAEHGHGHFIRVGRGKYQLRDRGFSQPLYLKLREAHPHFFLQFRRHR
jgi:hypothetical protein